MSSETKRPIVYIASAQALVWAGIYYIFPALLLRWEMTFGWSKSELTAAITLAIFVSAFVAPLAGKIIDMGKGHIMMALCTFCGGLCLIALSMVTQLTEFYLLWGVMGVMMAGSMYEPCFALITRARGKKAKQGIILVTLIAGFASAISFSGMHGLAENFGWRRGMQIFAAAVILVATPLMWAGASGIESSATIATKSQGPQPKSDLKRRFLRSPVFWLLAVGFSLGAVLHGVTLHHLLPMLDERGVSNDLAVFAASFIGPMQVAGRLAMMAVARHVSNHGIAISCFVVMICSVSLLLGAGATPLLLVGFVILFGGGYGIVSIIRPVIARDILGEQQFGAKSGALASLYLAGSASAPYLGSLIWSVGGYSLVLSCLIVIALLGLALYLLAHSLSRSGAKSQIPF